MIFCENIVKILWTWQLFFLLIHRFHNFFFHFRQWDCHNCQNNFFFFFFFFFFTLSAMGLPQLPNFFFFFFLHYRQWDCHNCQNNFFFFFFLHYWQWDCHNCQNIFFFFFFTFSVMPLPQLICHKFFELIIINHVWFIVKILCTWQLFFFTHSQIS